MKTLILDINKDSLALAAKLIKDGEIVAFPTETVYGLGANVFDENAVKKIYEAKGRPGDDPLIAHVADADGVYSVAAEVTEDAMKIMRGLMPGPVTMVLKKKSSVPDTVTAGLDTVAIRMPLSEEARAFISAAGVPICAPSANTSSRPSPTTWRHVAEDMDGRIPLILKGKNCDVGIESTVLDLTRKVPLILRPGMVTKSKIESVLGKEVFFPDAVDKSMNSPGIRYKHYAPKCDTYLNVDGDREKIRAFLDADAGAGLVASEKYRGMTDKFFTLGDGAAGGAHEIFAALRDAEKSCGKILIVWDEKGEEADSVYNRVIKSCGGKVI